MTTQQPLTPLSLAILLALLDGELHGYGIMKAVEMQSKGRVKAGAGSLYAALDRLIRDGLIDEREGEREGSQRKFALNRSGRAAARSEVERLADLVRYARQKKLVPQELP
jgi:DNA-binding PadR family transcriptional regulator